MVPTLVSAGTNLKVLEALAMERAVIATPSGCAGLGLHHGADVWIAEKAEDFAQGVIQLLSDRDLRQRVAAAGRRAAEQRFDWRQIGRAQRELLREISGGGLWLRRVRERDIDAIVEIQQTAPEASQWTRDDYTKYDCHVAELNSEIAGFIVSRPIADGEREILNVAVHPEMRRCGVASALIRYCLKHWGGTHFLEVRQSNAPARELYRKLGFQEVGVRPDYYDEPSEPAIVMRFYS
jgi:ribosomal-protein-alanine N-acetyltransferase